MVRSISTGGRVHGIFTSLFGEGIINPPRIYVYHAATVSLLSVRAFVSHAGIWAPRSISLRLHAPERVCVRETAMSYVAIEISAGVRIHLCRDQVAEMRSESDSHLWETRSSLVSAGAAPSKSNLSFRLRRIWVFCNTANFASFSFHSIRIPQLPLPDKNKAGRL